MSSVELARQIARRIVAAVHPSRVILFGSAAEARDNKESDIDLFVVWDAPQSLSPRERRMALRRAVGRQGVPVDVLTCTQSELEEALKDPRSFTSRIWQNGLVLHR